jgi:hypothetical protein
MIGKDLHAGANDEHHQEEFQEVQQPQPAGESGRDGGRGPRHTRIAQQHASVPRRLPQRLRSDCANHQQDENDGPRPLDADPALADPASGHDTRMRRQPLTQSQTVVGCAQALAPAICVSGHRACRHTAHRDRFWRQLGATAGRIFICRPPDPARANGPPVRRR